MKDFWQKKCKEKKLCILAPMDWYTDSAYRQVVKKVAPHVICFTEFFSSDGLIHSKFLAKSVLPHDESENPLIFQIFWKDPEIFAKASKIIEKYDIAWIDINMWCPAKKVVKSWHGSGLIINRDIAFEIVKKLNEATKLPISVKTRLWFNWSESLIEFAMWLEKSWASLLSVHGRTTAQAYTWKADFTQIYEVKKHLNIPVICNWDIKNYEDGMKKVKNLDWFMIWRASFWNPWCFIPNWEEYDREWNKRPWKFIDWQYFPTLDEILEMMKFHSAKLIETKWEKKWTLDIRKHLVQYLKWFPWVSKYRKRLVTIDSYEELEKIIWEIKIEFMSSLNLITDEISEG